MYNNMFIYVFYFDYVTMEKNSFFFPKLLCVVVRCALYIYSIRPYKRKITKALLVRGNNDNEMRC